MQESDLIKFINTYLTSVRRYSSILSEKRKNLLPDFWSYPFQILGTICKDGIVIEFRRRIRKKVNSIRVSKKNSINKIIPILSGSKVLIPANGLNGIVVKDLAITTESCFPFLKPSGTLLIIPDHFGLTKVSSGGDILFENVGIFYLDKKGTPRQFTIQGMWVIANDSPSFFTSENAEKRSFIDFVQRLVKTGAILGKKKKRYTEFNFKPEIETIKKEYINLINSENISEHEMHDFLEKHKYIISPLYLDISPKSIDIIAQKDMSSIKRRVDFILMQEPNFIKYNIFCTVIEIKKPTDKPFLASGEMSQPLKIGIEQILKIIEFVDSDLTEAQRYLPINDRSDIRGIVLIGRKKDLSLEVKKRLEVFNKDNNNIRIMLYDDLLENISFVSNLFGKKLQQPAVIVGQTGSEGEDFTGKTGEVIQKALDYLSKRIEKKV